MNSKDRLQHQLITHLLKEGQVEFVLPNGLKVELGITKDTKHGKEKIDDYVWMVASQDDKIISLDSYNLGLQFSRDRLVLDEEDSESHTLAVI
jgi:hypothetical protein